MESICDAISVPKAPDCPHFPRFSPVDPHVCVAVRPRRLWQKLLLPWHVKNVIYLELECSKLLNVFLQI